MLTGTQGTEEKFKIISANWLTKLQHIMNANFLIRQKKQMTTPLLSF